ncbi:MAG: tRNA (adenosine(37)-N6)-dimethylallyltransferase MiaA [Patescibacteria group bacterium]|jgi:tRNA dimethylallyltransferase
MIIITGQTATGKTKLALELAQKYNGELINFDSRQIYKYLDIITGKDIPKEKIWLYDIVTPDQYFSSFDFVKQLTPIIADTKKRGKTPILVGGTYLYLKHFLYGIDDNNSPPNFMLREKLNNKSVDHLQKMLIKLNKTVFENLNHSDQLNPRRLIRKIEIASKKTSAVEERSGKTAEVNKDWPVKLFIGLRYKDKSKLRQVIKKRVEERLKNGAIEEVKKLLKMGYKQSDPGMKTIGYQQIIKYLSNDLTKEKAVEDWMNKEVQYAKRQLTFMKKDKNISWKEI